MQDLWNWSGTFFGKRDGDALFSHHGREAGRFHGDEFLEPTGVISVSSGKGA